MSAADSADRRVEATRWLAIADQDLAAARLCLAAASPLPAVAAYHCRQAAEKIIKALLVAAGTPFPKTHDLAALNSLASPLYPQSAMALAALEPITVWGFAYRYPPEEEGDATPPPADIRRRIREIEELFRTSMDGIAARG